MFKIYCEAAAIVAFIVTLNLYATIGAMIKAGF